MKSHCAQDRQEDFRQWAGAVISGRIRRLEAVVQTQPDTEIVLKPEVKELKGTLLRVDGIAAELNRIHSALDEARDALNLDEIEADLRARERKFRYLLFETFRELRWLLQAERSKGKLSDINFMLTSAHINWALQGAKGFTQGEYLVGEFEQTSAFDASSTLADEFAGSIQNSLKPLNGRIRALVIRVFSRYYLQILSVNLPRIAIVFGITMGISGVTESFEIPLLSITGVLLIIVGLIVDPATDRLLLKKWKFGRRKKAMQKAGRYLYRSFVLFLIDRAGLDATTTVIGDIEKVRSTAMAEESRGTSDGAAETSKNDDSPFPD